VKGDKHIHEYIRSEQAKGSSISSIRKGLHEKGVHPKKVDHHLRISYKFDQSIIDYVHKEIRKKYTIDQITQALLKVGHEKEKVIEHVRHAHHLHKKKKKKQAFSIIGTALIFIAIVLVIVLRSNPVSEEFSGEHWDLLRQEAYDQARDGFLRDLESNPDDISAKTGLGIAYTGTGEFEKGLPLLAEAVDHYQDDLKLKRTYATALQQAGRLEEAKEEYTELLELFPDDGEILTYIGWIYFTQERYTEAEGQFSAAILTGYVPAHIGFARVAMKTDRYNVAVESFSEAKGTDEFNPDQRANYGYSLMMIDDLEEARKELEKAIKEDPNNGFAYQALGDVDMIERKFDDAYANYEKVLELSPASFGIYIRIGRNFYSRENFPLAVEAYTKALEYEPDSIELRTSLAWSYYQAGEYEDALASFAGIKEEKETGEYESGYGLTLEKMGRFEEAKTHLEKAIELDEPYHAYIGLGRIAYKEGNFRSASVSYSRALEIMDKENKQGVGDISRYQLEIEIEEGPS
jgi:tetratricopeptide (TPR) repeat protein